MDTPNPTHTTPRLVYACPHCSGVLDLTPLVSPSSTAMDPATATPTAGRAPAALERWEPIVRVLRQLAMPGSALPGLPRWLRWGLSALLLLFLLSVLIWQQWAAPSPPALAPAAAATNAAGAPFPDRGATAPLSADQATALAVVAAYNAAEPEVGQTLSLQPILPLLVPDGPLARQRAQAIAQRQATQATHATRLLRWAVGAIVIDTAGTRATVTTQETWEDQVGSLLPRTATVRVVYTLRRADAQSAWRIADAQQTVL
jgi:hypothetical protein